MSSRQLFGRWLPRHALTEFRATQHTRVADELTGHMYQDAIHFSALNLPLIKVSIRGEEKCTSA